MPQAATMSTSVQENGVPSTAEFDDVLGFGAVRVEPVEQSPQPADLMLDLGVSAAHRGGRVGAAQGAVDQRDEEFLVRAFVGE